MEKISKKGGGSVNKYHIGEDLKAGEVGVLNEWNLMVRYKKPEKPLIVKSGETFASHENGINYLCTKPKYWEKMKKEFSNIGFIDGPDFFKIADYWKPFTDKNGKHVDKNGNPFLELTDEIAKLRPMVVIHDVLNKESELRILTYIDDTIFQCRGVTMIKKDLFVSQLATAHELQELEK